MRCHKTSSLCAVFLHSSGREKLACLPGIVLELAKNSLPLCGKKKRLVSKKKCRLAQLFVLENKEDSGIVPRNIGSRIWLPETPFGGVEQGAKLVLECGPGKKEKKERIAVLPDIWKDMCFLPDIWKDMCFLPDIWKDMCFLPDIWKDMCFV